MRLTFLLRYGKTRREGAQWKPADFYAVYIGFRCAYDLTAKTD